MVKKRKAPASATTIAELVNELFKLYRHPEGREYTHKEVEVGITEVAGRKIIDASYLSKLRTGLIKRPSTLAVEALCYFFPVDVNYFFPNIANRQPRQTKHGENQFADAVQKHGGDPVAMRKHLQTLIRLLSDEKDE